MIPPVHERFDSGCLRLIQDLRRGHRDFARDDLRTSETGVQKIADQSLDRLLTAAVHKKARTVRSLTSGRREPC
jgi:hypothetical protein